MSGGRVRAARRVVLAGAGPLSLLIALAGLATRSRSSSPQYAQLCCSARSGSQIRPQLIAFAGSLGAHLVQRLLCIGANPSDFSLGGAGSDLGAGGVLLGLLGGGLGVGCRLTDPVAVGLGDLGTLPGLGVDRLDFGFGGGRVSEGVDPVRSLASDAVIR